MRTGTLALICCAVPLSVLAVEAPPSEDPSPSIEVPKETVRCISTYRIRSTKVLDARRIVFEVGRERLVNQLKRDCPGLRFEKRFGYRTRTNQLCRGDIIFVTTSTGRGASCALGSFEPYIKDEELGPGLDNDAIEVGTPGAES